MNKVNKTLMLMLVTMVSSQAILGSESYWKRFAPQRLQNMFGQKPEDISWAYSGQPAGQLEEYADALKEGAQTMAEWPSLGDTIASEQVFRTPGVSASERRALSTLGEITGGAATAADSFDKTQQGLSNFASGIAGAANLLERQKDFYNKLSLLPSEERVDAMQAFIQAKDQGLGTEFLDWMDKGNQGTFARVKDWLRSTRLAGGLSSLGSGISSGFASARERGVRGIAQDMGKRGYELAGMAGSGLKTFGSSMMAPFETVNAVTKYINELESDNPKIIAAKDMWNKMSPTSKSVTTGIVLASLGAAAVGGAGYGAYRGSKYLYGKAFGTPEAVEPIQEPVEEQPQPEESRLSRYGRYAAMPVTVPYGYAKSVAGYAGDVASAAAGQVARPFRYAGGKVADLSRGAYSYLPGLSSFRGAAAGDTSSTPVATSPSMMSRVAGYLPGSSTSVNANDALIESLNSLHTQIANQKWSNAKELLQNIIISAENSIIANDLAAMNNQFDVDAIIAGGDYSDNMRRASTKKQFLQDISDMISNLNQ